MRPEVGVKCLCAIILYANLIFIIIFVNIICYIRWKGYVPLSRSIDPKSGYKAGTDSSPPEGRVTRVLLQLSRGGADATHLREFDLNK